jgi:hypothetical protein
MKKTIAIDLDGVLAEYHGCQGPDHYDEPIPGVIEFLQDLIDADMQPVIFTTREGPALSAWLQKNCSKEILKNLIVTKTKPPIPTEGKPPNRGQIVCDDLVSLKFWVRVFGLEERVEETQKLIQAKLEKRTFGAIPIISDYQVSDELRWYYVMVLNVDALGLCGGNGIIFYADQANAAEAKRRHEVFAKGIMDAMEQSPKKWDEIIEMPSGKERL